MGIIIAMTLLSVLLIFCIVELWLLTECNITYCIVCGVATLIMIIVLICAWGNIFTCATPHTNQENITRYIELLEKVESAQDSTDSKYLESLYKEVAEWNEEYTTYQERIGNTRDGYRYPADRYEGCDTIDFWQSIR